MSGRREAEFCPVTGVSIARRRLNLRKFAAFKETGKFTRSTPLNCSKSYKHAAIYEVGLVYSRWTEGPLKPRQNAKKTNPTVNRVLRCKKIEPREQLFGQKREKKEPSEKTAFKVQKIGRSEWNVSNLVRY